jgi:hypothetical protein
MRSLSEGGIEGSRIGEGLGTYEEPFSAHRYRDIQRELSHVTLAQGVWTWNPREKLPPDKIKNEGFPTPDLEAVQFNSDGQYVHVQRAPGYETIVAGMPFHVGDEWSEWKGTWSVEKGELSMVSGPKEGRWGARREPQGWVSRPIDSDDDRAFKVAELTRAKLRLETRAIGDIDRSLQRTTEMPERPMLKNAKP